MAAAHAIQAVTTSQKPPQQLKQYSLMIGGQHSSLWVYEGLCAFSLGLVVPRWADLSHFHHTVSCPFSIGIETTMVRTISLPSSNRGDESTPRQRGVLATARSILMSGRGGRGRPPSSSIRHPPSSVDSSASNPLLPECRERPTSTSEQQ
jgi:hypothetical protein